mmetsp:Transcript_116645/g.341415  ORF Transcript_116645/g.341415 Transcript_116645/m.341415 type:complete len:212 (+) Transcript_116645:58-693(+)
MTLTAADVRGLLEDHSASLSSMIRADLRDSNDAVLQRCERLIDAKIQQMEDRIMAVLERRAAGHVQRASTSDGTRRVRISGEAPEDSLRPVNDDASQLRSPIAARGSNRGVANRTSFRGLPDAEQTLTSSAAAPEEPQRRRSPGSRGTSPGDSPPLRPARSSSTPPGSKRSFGVGSPSWPGGGGGDRHGALPAGQRLKPVRDLLPARRGGG